MLDRYSSANVITCNIRNYIFVFLLKDIQFENLNVIFIKIKLMILIIESSISMYLSIYLSTILSTYLTIYSYTYLLPIYLSTSPVASVLRTISSISMYLSIYLPFYLSFYLSISPVASVFPTISLPARSMKFSLLLISMPVGVDT